MGFFSSSNSSSKVANSNHNNKDSQQHQQQYEDIENIPVAVAVIPMKSNNNNNNTSPKQGGNSSNILTIHNNNNNSKRGGNNNGRRSLSPAPISLSTILIQSRNPILVPQCPQCYKTNVRTRTTTYPDFMTWVTCAVLLFIFWPICWIPLIMDSTRRTTHYCSACHNEIGSIRPFKDCCVKHR